MNVVVLEGRITKDLEIKKITSNNEDILLFSIAVQRQKDKVDFINCVAFGNEAVFINKYFKKGDGINIIGSLRQNSYETKEGKKTSEITVLVTTVSFPIAPKKEEPKQETTREKTMWESAKKMELSEEDMPFFGDE